MMHSVTYPCIRLDAVDKIATTLKGTKEDLPFLQNSYRELLTLLRFVFNQLVTREATRRTVVKTNTQASHVPNLKCHHIDLA